MRVSTLSVVALAQLAYAGVYDLKSSVSGQDFVDFFHFIGGWNDTLGGQAWNWWNSGDDFLTNVTQSKELGMLEILANGNVKLAVDTRPKIDYNQKRHSFRLESKNKYGFGTVFVFDAVHLPYGCSLWPAYWLTADDWPHGGEIDILENVNKRTNNQLVFHTGETCLMQPAEGSITGDVVLTDCTHKPDNNAGCAVRDPRNTSFGNGFNDAGGGVYITEFAEQYINIWFFPRANVPANLANAQSIDTATLGLPVAALPTSAGCDVKTNFDLQKIIINTSLCGNFAGETPVLDSSGCSVPENQTCYSTYVTGDNQPADYADAYFEIVSHRIFQSAGAQTEVSAPGGPTESTGPAPGGGGSSASSTGTVGGGSTTTRSGSSPSGTTTNTPGDAATSVGVAGSVLAFVLAAAAAAMLF